MSRGQHLNSLIPLSGQTADWGNSLMTGAKVANALMGRDNGMTDYQREMLDLRRQELSQSPSMTPYQARSLELREREAGRDRPVSAVEGIRGKLSRGEQLAPGEQRVYDDAMRVSAFDRFLLGQPGGQPQSNTPPPIGSPTPSDPTTPPAMAPRTQGGMIPPSAVQFLKANAHNPEVRRQFQEHYGQSADAFLR